jgi:putative ABC transport system permease protein
MWKNYLKIAWRNLVRQHLYAVINLTGLTVAMAVGLLLLLFVRHELSFESFHKNPERTYRLYAVIKLFNTEGIAIVPSGLSNLMKQEIPDIESIVDVFGDKCKVKVGDKWFESDYGYGASPELIDIFNFELQDADIRAALSKPHSVILSQETAVKFFGDENPVGKTFTRKLWNDSLDVCIIAGVLKPIPHNTHFRPAWLYTQKPYTGSVMWSSFGVHTYLTLKPQSTIDEVKAKFDTLIAHHKKSKARSDFAFQPLSEIHFTTKVGNEIYVNDKNQTPNNDTRYVILFGGIGLLILLAAAINYMNLSTARFSPRAKEVGIRKSLGANRRELIGQFLSESLLLSLLALPFALALLELLLPVFTSLSGIRLELNYFSLTSPLWVALAITVVFGTIAGLYPALFLSRFKPVETLKGIFKTTRLGAFTRQTLVVVQFTTSTCLILCTLIAFLQLRYIQEKRLGFDKENLVAISAELLKTNVVAFKEELLKLSGVENGTLQYWPGGARAIGSETDSLGNRIDYAFLRIDTAFFSTLKLELVEGRNFSSESGGDIAQPNYDDTLVKPPPRESMSIILNETACNAFGLPHPTGKTINNKFIQGTVVGVVKDFHLSDLRQAIMPMVLNFSGGQVNKYGDNVTIRIRANQTEQTMAAVDSVWKIFSPYEPLKAEFVDQSLQNFYTSDKRMVTLFMVFALISVSIACLGLFGLISFSAEQRTKEIGIRKILGASVASITALLSKDFLKMVAIAFIIASPIAYLGMTKWLEDYAYKVDLAVWMFLSGGIIALLLAFLTVCYQAIKAAQQNPVKSLRYE